VARYDDDEGGFGNGGMPDFERGLALLRRLLLPAFIGVLLLLGAYTSYYQIEPEEVGLVTRLGKYISASNPGLHFKLPLGIDQVIRIPVKRQLKAEFGFRTARAAVKTEYTTNEDTEREAAMLTGDLNVAQVEWIVQYKIRDPKMYVFNVRNPIVTLRDMTEAAMRRVVGDHSVTEVLTVGREQVQLQTKAALQELCNRYEIGIEVLQLVLQDVNPPAPVRESFNEVNQALQEKERAINQAWAKYNSVIPEARGKAQQSIEAAEGYATARVNEAQGDVAKFVALQEVYAKAPKVTRARLYLERIAEVYPKAKRRVFIDDEVKGLLPLLSLDGGKTVTP
jgi:membrane protease subunit HflK